jgi:virginiamycin B lyase
MRPEKRRPKCGRYAVIVVLTAVATAACGGRVAPGLPEPVEMIEFVIPWTDAFPSDVAVDDAGRVWFTDRLISVIGRFDPETGEFTSFPTPTPKSAPYGLVRVPDGTLWYGASRAGRLGHVDPESGRIEEHVIAASDGGPHLLAVAGDQVWFTMREDQRFGRFDPSTGEGALFDAPGRAGAGREGVSRRWQPYGIAAGRDGVIWIGEYAGGGLLRFDPATNETRPVDLREEVESSRSLPANLPDSIRRQLERVSWRAPVLRRIATDARGTVWLTSFRGGTVESLHPQSGERGRFPSVAPRSQPYGIAVDAAGRVWYNESGNSAIVVLDPITGERRSFAIPTKGATVRHLTFDEERKRVWLPLSDTGRLGLLQLR